MVFTIQVNNREIEARKGETILEALRRAGFEVPTLCNMKDFTPTGACRMCVVEVEGRQELVPSCSHHVEEWMKISTHSPRVIKARRTITELLLSNHPDDCLYCEKNGNCELQKIAEEMHIRERKIPGSPAFIRPDRSSPGLTREPAKCILCGRCVRVCEEIQQVATLDFIYRGSSIKVSPAFDRELNFSNCIQCGQCLLVCPTGALTGKVSFTELESKLHDTSATVVAHYSPSVPLLLAEKFRLKPSVNASGVLKAVLSKLGFDRVFESAFGTEVFIMEEAALLLQRIRNNEYLPVISSACPAWVSFAETEFPDLLPYLSTCRSPQQMASTLAKVHIAEEETIKKPETIYTVAISPCTARKYESRKPELTRKGLPDTDLAISITELFQLIRLYGLDPLLAESEAMPQGLRSMTSAGKLSDISGGITEGVIRTFYSMATGKDLKEYRIEKLRNHKSRRDYTLKAGNHEYRFAVLSGFAMLPTLIEEIRSGTCNLHYVEIMACPGGCVGGGGQPSAPSQQILRQRIKDTFEYEEKEIMKCAHRSPEITELYEKKLDKPGSKKAMELLHTHFTACNIYAKE